MNHESFLVTLKHWFFAFKTYNKAIQSSLQTHFSSFFCGLKQPLRLVWNHCTMLQWYWCYLCKHFGDIWCSTPQFCEYIELTMAIFVGHMGSIPSRRGELFHIPIFRCHNMIWVFQAYHKTSNIRRTILGNKIVDHSDVVGASPVCAALTTSSFST